MSASLGKEIANCKHRSDAHARFAGSIRPSESSICLKNKPVQCFCSRRGRVVTQDSGEEIAHKHEQFCPVTVWVRGGFSRLGVQGSNVSVLCVRNPRNINIFVRVPGR